MIKIMQLEKMNPGSFQNEKVYVDHLMKINGAKIEIDENHIKVVKDGNVFIDSKIDETSSSDFLTQTDFAKFSNGQGFRIIRASAMAAGILEQTGGGINFSISSLSGDGYSAQFMLVEQSKFEDDKVIDQKDQVESKAEILAIAAAGSINSNQQATKDYIDRFLSVLSTNKLDFLRADDTKNLVNGHIMAIQLGIKSQDEVAELLKKCRLNFTSNYHVRWQGDDIVRGQATDRNGRNFAERGIVVEPNFTNQVGFVVYLYNGENDNDLTETNMQMSPKTMKTYEINAKKIAMRGFGEDHRGQNNSDYGIVIVFENNEIHHIELHMIDRNVTIGYY